MSSQRPITVDNLGIGASNDYATRQEQYETYLKEIGAITPAGTPSSQPPAVPTIDTATPALAPLAKAFDIGKAALWATLPQLATFSSARLFSFELAPSLGTSDDLADLKEKFESLKTDSRLEPSEQATLKVLCSLINLLYHLQRIFEDIEGKRNQYQRG